MKFRPWQENAKPTTIWYCIVVFFLTKQVKDRERSIFTVNTDGSKDTLLPFKLFYYLCTMYIKLYIYNVVHTYTIGI